MKKTSKRAKAVSQYEQYPLPFFDAKRRLTWAVETTGSYPGDCELGVEYARAFLKSCDRTVGWGSLLGQMVCHMAADPENAKSRKGLIIGFFSELSRAFCIANPINLLLLTEESDGFDWPCSPKSAH